MNSNNTKNISEKITDNKEHKNLLIKVFYTDPYDPVVSDMYNELKRIVVDVKEENIEQSILKVEIKFKSEQENEVISLLNGISYVPLKFKREQEGFINNPTNKQLLERQFKTRISHFHRDKEFIYPVLKTGDFIYRSPDEIFYFKEFVINK